MGGIEKPRFYTFFGGPKMPLSLKLFLGEVFTSRLHHDLVQPRETCLTVLASRVTHTSNCYISIENTSKRFLCRFNLPRRAPRIMTGADALDDPGGAPAT